MALKQQLSSRSTDLQIDLSNVSKRLTVQTSLYSTRPIRELLIPLEINQLIPKILAQLIIRFINFPKRFRNSVTQIIENLTIIIFKGPGINGNGVDGMNVGSGTFNKDLSVWHGDDGGNLLIKKFLFYFVQQKIQCR